MRRGELSVRCVMNLLRDLEVLDLEVLGRATVGDVAALLQRFGMHHPLVAESSTPQDPAHIRGVISHAEVERQLGSPPPPIVVARNFAEIALALA